MTGMKNLTKRDLIELIEKTFPEPRPTETIAALFIMSESDDAPKQQCILFKKEVEE